MNIKNHAITEFKAAGWIDSKGKFRDEMQELMCTQVLELLELFSTHGHTGATAPYAIELFAKLARREPLVPLTGQDCEWQEVESGVYQNIRCSHVFKDAERFNGQAYDINGRVFREPSGVCFTSRDSVVPIEFPYSPTTEYIDVEEEK